MQRNSVCFCAGTKESPEATPASSDAPADDKSDAEKLREALQEIEKLKQAMNTDKQSLPPASQFQTPPTKAPNVSPAPSTPADKARAAPTTPATTPLQKATSEKAATLPRQSAITAMYEEALDDKEGSFQVFPCLLQQDSGADCLLVRAKCRSCHPLLCGCGSGGYARRRKPESAMLMPKLTNNGSMVAQAARSWSWP